MAESMLDKVARAIARADEQNGAWPYEKIIQEKHNRNALYDRARAALQAVRDDIEAYLKHDEEGLVQWLDDQLS